MYLLNRKPFAIMAFCIGLLTACHQNQPKYNGYIDADLTYLSSNFPGRLTQLMIKRGEPVKKNQLLFKLEQTSEQDEVTISHLNQESLLSQRKALLDQIHYASINHHRTKNMHKQDAASQNDLDVAQKDLSVLNAQLAAIDFQIKSAQKTTDVRRWQMDRKEGRASDTGIVFDTYFTQDEYVQAGQPILSLITRPNIKVIFFVSEQELSQIHLNAKITVSADNAPQLATGTIQYISSIAQYTPPIIYSRENRQELVFRVEARIDSPHLNQVHLGQPVSLELLHE